MPDKGKYERQNGPKAIGPEDIHLWELYTQDVQPIRKYRPSLKASTLVLEQPATPQAKPGAYLSPKASGDFTSSVKGEVQKTPPARQMDPVSSRQLDGRTEERLRKGRLSIDGTLDLHGYNQERAHGLLNQFILASHERGARCLLIITGKGKRMFGHQDEDSQRGILRQKFPQWMSQPPLSDITVKFCPAAPHHGGSGAWYVYLRRTRD